MSTATQRLASGLTAVGCLLVLTALSGCTTSQVRLTYRPATPLPVVSEPTALIRVGEFRDLRDSGQFYIGRHQLTEILTSEPVAEDVRAAFFEGVRQRGLLAVNSPAKFELYGAIHRLEANQVVRREATVEIDVHLKTAGSGSPFYAKTHRVSHREGHLLSDESGLFSTEDELTAIASQALSTVVDRSLNEIARLEQLR